VVIEMGRDWSVPDPKPGAVATARAGGSLRGLFAGGTLCDEAMILAAARLGPIMSNIPLEPGWALDDDLASAGHTMIDFGDDRLTQGRPHPMIDGSMRIDRMRREIADPSAGVLLLDVVLGFGAAADPASELAAPIAEATAAGLPVLVSLVGTRDDPQGTARQSDVLHEAGAAVFVSNAAAARAAADLVSADATAGTADVTGEGR
jgi:FdrA protein